MIVAQARQKIVDRSKLIGQDFEGEIRRLQSEADWDARLAEATNPDVTLPAYYTQPFHAYENGELQAAVCFRFCTLLILHHTGIHAFSAQVRTNQGQEAARHHDMLFLPVTAMLQMLQAVPGLQHQQQNGCR